MTLSELRRRHPRLVFESFETKISESSLEIIFSLRLEPDIVFHPRVHIPITGIQDKPIVDTFAFHLGLMECISYWKVACPAELVVKAGSLDPKQIAWWHDLFLNGLGEFFFTNKIDFTRKDFLHVTVGALGGSPFARSVKAKTFPSPLSPGAKAVTELENARLPAPLLRDLVLVGGGKDSVVALEVLKKTGREIRPIILNPKDAAIRNIRLAGLPDPILVRRTIDPKLIDLNKTGYLNGHTPFSAYLAFLGLFVATLYGYEHVIVANEASASEGNVMYKGFEINHQYSKSFRFEKRFRDYAADYLPTKSKYFSLLRPLNELQIAMLFSRYPQYFSSFRSCNVGSKTDSWCGACPKCAFSWLILSPFIAKDRMVAIFGSDLSKKPIVARFIRELVGLGEQKPFECVGTKDECKVALHFDDPKLTKLKETLLKNWNSQHFVPQQYANILRRML